jgi:lipopolysaccharide/colanic/teichoic acid biosynthesis glycosyltransferase
MYLIVKRIFDIIASLIALVILFPFLFIIMLLLWITGEHKVFYLQERIGYKNKTFKIIKFATMLKNSPKIGTGSITLRNDPRVLPIGKILRKTKLNELPQIINVIIGDMSIVGPRPQMKVDLEKFPNDIQKILFNQKPGITGIGSILFRDEELLISESKLDPHIFYTNEIAPYKGELELWYQHNISIKTDILIIFLTIWYIFFSKSNLVVKLFKDLPKKNF